MEIKKEQKTCDLFNATFNVREPISKSIVVRTIQRLAGSEKSFAQGTTYICFQ